MSTRRIFELSDEDAARLLEASAQAAQTPVIYTPAPDQKIEDVRSWADYARDEVMRIWRELGEKYGFKWETAEDSGRGAKFVSAEEIEGRASDVPRT